MVFQPHFHFPHEFPSTCTVPNCKYIVTDVDDLLHHEKMHSISTSRRHVCYKCHCAYSSRQALQTHLNTSYLRIGLYLCSCGSRYSDPSRKARCLRSHMGRYRCSYSDYVNARKELVLRHIYRKHHTDARYCSIIFDTSKGRPFDPPERRGLQLHEPTPDLMAQLSRMQDISYRYNVLRIEALAGLFDRLGHPLFAGEARLHAQEITRHLRPASSHGESGSDTEPAAINPADVASPASGDGSPGLLDGFPTSAELLVPSPPVGSADFNYEDYLRDGKPSRWTLLGSATLPPLENPPRLAPASGGLPVFAHSVSASTDAPELAGAPSYPSNSASNPSIGAQYWSDDPQSNQYTSTDRSVEPNCPHDTLSLFNAVGSVSSVVPRVGVPWPMEAAPSVVDNGYNPGTSAQHWPDNLQPSLPPSAGGPSYSLAEPNLKLDLDLHSLVNATGFLSCTVSSCDVSWLTGAPSSSVDNASNIGTSAQHRPINRQPDQYSLHASSAGGSSHMPAEPNFHQDFTSVFSAVDSLSSAIPWLMGDAASMVVNAPNLGTAFDNQPGHQESDRPSSHLSYADGPSYMSAPAPTADFLSLFNVAESLSGARTSADVPWLTEAPSSSVDNPTKPSTNAEDRPKDLQLDQYSSYGSTARGLTFTSADWSAETNLHSDFHSPSDSVESPFDPVGVPMMEYPQLSTGDIDARGSQITEQGDIAPAFQNAQEAPDTSEPDRGGELWLLETLQLMEEEAEIADGFDAYFNFE